MSTEYVIAEIERFLTSDENAVLCISGAWGVGKTFTWRKIVQEIGSDKKIKAESYSYVSLFGLKTYEEVKREIFRKTVSTTEPLRKSDEETVSGQLSKVFDGIKGNLGAFGAVFGNKGSAVSSLLEELSFAAIRNRLICFDDLERAGADISIKDVLGLAHYLNEERDCKVVILLNDDKFDDEQDHNAFREQFEKVVHSNVVFAPSPDEALGIALEVDGVAREQIRKVMKAVSCNNIRIIKKIERIYNLCLIEDHPDHEKRQFAHTIAVAAYLRFGVSDTGALQGLRSFNTFSFVNDGEEQEKDWVQQVKAAGYLATDDVDLLLIDAVEKGYVEEAKLERALEDSRKHRILHGLENEFSKAWESFHSNLRHEPADIVSTLSEAMKSMPEAISPSNASGTLNLMDELGFEDAANDAAKVYFAERDFDFRQLEDDHFLWLEGRANPRFQAEVDRLKDTFVDNRRPSDIIKKMTEDSGWGRRDIQLLNTLNVQQLVTMIDELEGEDLTRNLRFLRTFVGSQDDQYQPFGERLQAAFVEISHRSPSVEKKLRAERLLPREDAN
ncbi:hypothetical protein Q9K02_10965 [Qipengyuania sp. G39]|uniref:KAP NTPase domain-containing protein n=1 Tax=Qipengyuania profundimaris TaxID=3067652 RepID=A0ABT9HR75_9SPHN|nr:hypothetical protein [Qipengyuania sp. G39]MDP4575659.1 hypothetical protein [Qipengyuania sp. G39]